MNSDMAPQTSSLRTLIVDLSARFGGASARTLGVLSSIPSGQAALACLDGTPVLERARCLGLEVYPLGVNKLDPRLRRGLAQIIREGGFQVVDTQNTQSKLWGSLAAMQTGAALVSTLNSWYETERQGSLKGRVYQKIEQVTARATHLFIAVAPDIRDYLLASGISAESVALILNAVEIDPENVPGNKAWLCETFALPDTAKVVCTVGRLVPAKGYEHLITAFEYLVAVYPALHCLIVGDGELRGPLTAQIQRAGLQDRIHLLGFRSPDEALSIVKASDFFAMPSVTEGTPIALLEAGALAKPIVASRVGGIPDILSDEETGLLVNPGDAGAIAAALRRLIGDAQFTQQLGQAAQKRVARDFSRRGQVAATLNAYQAALRRRDESRRWRVPEYT